MSNENQNSSPKAASRITIGEWSFNSRVSAKMILEAKMATGFDLASSDPNELRRLALDSLLLFEYSFYLYRTRLPQGITLDDWMEAIGVEEKEHLAAEVLNAVKDFFFLTKIVYTEELRLHGCGSLEDMVQVAHEIQERTKALSGPSTSQQEQPLGTTSET